MIIEDFVMLGRTTPEESKKHGLVVCSAGYSKELRGFVRIYPIGMFEKIPRWSVCSAHLRRNNGDSRIESWRIQEDKQPVIQGKENKDSEFDFLQSMASDSIADLNNQRKSLGIIKPENMSFSFSKMKHGAERQLQLLEGGRPDEMRPRVQFSDKSGFHDLQLRDWGSNIFINKNPGYEYKVWDALKLTDPSYEHIFFVGNMNNHRNNWLVISVISRKTQYQTDLF